MSQEQFYQTVQMEEEYMSKMKEFTQQMREEFMASDEQYCCYCGEAKHGKHVCCGENHFVPFSDLYEDMQDAIIQEELNEYEKATK